MDNFELNNKTQTLVDTLTQYQLAKRLVLSHKLLEELYESAVYWSEYDVPIGIVDRIKEQLDSLEIEQ